MHKAILPVVLLALAASGAAQAQNVHVNPSNGFISQAVKVPAGSEMLYVSGITPDVVPGALAATPFGDTKAQVISVLTKIEPSVTGIRMPKPSFTCPAASSEIASRKNSKPLSKTVRNKPS